MNGDINESSIQHTPLMTRRRFTAGTILIPAAAIGLHFAVANLFSLLYIIAYAFLSSSLNNANPLQILTNPNEINRIFNEQYPIMTFIYCAALIPVYLIYLRIRQKRDSRVLMSGKPGVSITIMAVIIMIGAIGITNYWMTLLYSAGETIPFVRNALNDYEKLAGVFSSTAGYFWLILGVCVMAPVTEELLFRGVIQGELRKAVPDWAAIIIQALLFALYHMQVIQISYVIIPGLLLGLLYYWSRSIWVPIAMHVTYNILGTILPDLIGDDVLAGTIAGYASLVFIVVGIGLVIYLFARHRNSRSGIQAGI
jgi:uncharacterized protein